MSALNEPNAMLRNLIVISEQFEEGQFVSITFFGSDAKEIVSLLHVRKGVEHDIDETISDIVRLIESVYKDVGDIEGLAFVVLNPEGHKASEVGRALSFHPAFDKYPLFAVMFTDGYRWHEVFDNEGGEVDHSEITDFQLRSIVDNDNITEYTGMNQ